MPPRHDWRTFRSPGHRLVLTTVRVSEKLKRAADRFLRPYRLSLPQFNLLAVLYANPEGAQQSKLGEEFTVSRANVTGLVRRLAARGLCSVGTSDRDARIRRVRITRRGTELLNRIERPYFLEIARITGTLDGRSMDKTSDLLERLSRVL